MLEQDSKNNKRKQTASKMKTRPEGEIFAKWF